MNEDVALCHTSELLDRMSELLCYPDDVFAAAELEGILDELYIRFSED